MLYSGGFEERKGITITNWGRGDWINNELGGKMLRVAVNRQREGWVSVGEERRDVDVVTSGRCLVVVVEIGQSAPRPELTTLRDGCGSGAISFPCKLTGC